jgi:hypothetical protein
VPNGDGHLELVAQNSKLVVWKLPGSSTRADWPMFKQDAARSGFIGPSYSVAPQEVLIPHLKGTDAVYDVRIGVSSYLGSLSWTLTSDNAQAISIPRSTGSTISEDILLVQVRAGAGLNTGNMALGTLTLNIDQGGQVMAEQIPVRVQVMNRLEKSFLPVSQ